MDQVRESGGFLTPTVAEVHLNHLRHNADVFRSGRAEVMAVVKADAYGHGASRVARVLSEMGIKWFAVATPAEGVTLRRSGLDGRILVLSAPLPRHLFAYPQYELDVTVSSSETAEAVMARASRGGAFRVHVKIDTGMGRIGVSPDRSGQVVAALETARNVEIVGIWTHLATADSNDTSYVYEQLERFNGVLAEVGDSAEYVHAANSAAALRIPESVDFDRSIVRAGIGLYGYTSLDGLAERHGLQPAMTVTSCVTHTKTVAPGTSVSYGRSWRADRATRIATVGAGYADGYPRLLGNRSRVGIRGTLHPVVGTICMDTFMVDVGADSPVSVDDEVVLFGSGGPDASALAAWAQTIPYEILTSVASRVPRVYVP